MGRLVGLKEAHPAGIWCDRSIDGPIIGTLVVVLDRAKNLPNKKKIGKQDPYAVARLAKEAKRTDTDLRGGQTPRWDKELRFPVRDSPDYKTLKISVFNDDKKTDLIGEATIGVEKILVKGGGTDDGWRILKCKEKYAGDILVELTFWDMRPKEEPASDKKKKPAAVGFKDTEPAPTSKKIGGAREMGSGRTMRGRDGRRPLPSDPTVTVEDSKATRRSRHSYHPQSSAHLGAHHQHSHSEPKVHQSRSRGSRHVDSAPPPSRGGYTPPAPHGFDNGPLEIYDPYPQDNYIPGPILGRDEIQDDGYGNVPPPPPPAHGRPMTAHESSFQQTLRHHQSVPDWQNMVQQGRSINHRHSFDPRTQFSFAPEPVELEDPSVSLSSRYSRNSSGFGMMQEDDVPPLSYSTTPISSTSSSRDGPPPPPPPHRHNVSMGNGAIDEPNWDNQTAKPPRQNSIHDDLGLPPYEPPRSRPSSSMGMSFGADQVQHPPILVPGIDPAVADELSERIEHERRLSFNDVIQPLQIRQIPSKVYHAPQVEEVQDVQLFQPELLPEEKLIDRPTTLKKKGDRRSTPMVKPMPIHGEWDAAVPAVGASRNSMKKNGTLVMTPERKPVPAPSERAMVDLPFSPDSYNVLNPNPAASLAALESQRGPDKMIMPGSDRVMDPTDVLGPETFAPEPEKKRTPRPPPPVPVEHRRQRVDRRAASPQPPRGPRLSLPPAQSQDTRLEKSERNRLQKKSIRASQSMAILPSASSFADPYANSGMSNAMVMYDPRSEQEREWEMERERDSRALVPTSGGENYSYRPSSSRNSGGGMELTMYGSHNAAPPVPAKVPMSREDYLLSQEMSMINIGAGDGGRTRRGRDY